MSTIQINQVLEPSDYKAIIAFLDKMKIDYSIDSESNNQQLLSIINEARQEFDSGKTKTMSIDEVNEYLTT